MNIKSLIAGVLIAFFSFQSFAKGGGTNAVVYAAATQGDVARLKEYFAADTNLLTLRNGLLRTAAMSGQKDAVEFLISQGADVNEKGFIEMTPLAHMAMYGTRNDEMCAEVATVLLAHGAEVDPVDGYKATPLLHAVESKKSQLARVLLEHGANITQRYTGVNGGMTPLHMAVMDKDKETVAVLLKFKAPVDTVDRDGATPLLMAEGRNEEEIAAMLRKANPEATKGVPTYSIPPTKEEMRALAKRIADGDDAAFDELANTSQKLYAEIKDYQKEHARVMVLLFRMHAAFDLLGEEAGKGNEKAFQALKKCLGQKSRFQAFAPDALGIAAAGGNKEALDILIHYEDWGMLESSARFAICVPTAANVEPAVDYFANWLLNLKPYERNSGVVDSATNALGSAAAKGSQKAQAALEKFIAAAPKKNE
jgi:ankyrin repeat protein